MYLPLAVLAAVPFGIAPVLSGLGAVTAAVLFARLARRPARRAQASGTPAVPLLRRADAHPDAPPRAPLLATRDLDAPFLDDRTVEVEQGRPLGRPDRLLGDFGPPPEPAERALPHDLSQPLAAFDPGAMLRVPLAPPAKLPPLRSRPRAGGSTWPRSACTDERIARPETDATIHALLDRLERGVIRNGLAIGVERAPGIHERRRADRGLDDALVTLRNLARSA